MPIKLTAKAPPKVLNSMSVEVATPIRCRDTEFCTATSVVRLAIPIPVPINVALTMTQTTVKIVVEGDEKAIADRYKNMPATATAR